VSKKLKGVALRSNFELTPFDQMLSLCVGVLICFLGLLAINPLKSAEQLLGNAWSFSEDAQAQIVAGTYGPEIDDMEWLTGNPLKIQISNPQAKTIKVSLGIKFGASPCGTFPKVLSGIVLGMPNEAGVLVGQSVLEISPKSYKTLVVIFEASVCQIPTDPRNFTGSVFQPSLTQL
jgi:hypothetical protein